MEKENYDYDKLEKTLEGASIGNYAELMEILRVYPLNAITKRYINQIARRLDLDVFDILRDIEKSVSEKKTPKLISFSELIREPEEPISFIIEPLLPIQSIMLLTGRRANFKSIFAGDLARCISTGQRLLDWETTPTKVVIIDMENRPRLTKKRLQELGTPETADIHFLFRREMQGLNIETDHALLSDICKDSVVIIDTLSKIHMRDENRNSEMTAVMSALLNLIESKAIKALVILHHQGKNIELGGRGASVIEDNPDIIVELMRTGTAARFKCTKHREVQEDKLTRDIRFDFSENSIRIVDIGNEEFYRFLRAFEALPEDNLKSQGAIIEALQAQGWTREGITSYLDQGVKQGYLMMTKDRQNNNAKKYSLKLDTHIKLVNGEFGR